MGASLLDARFMSVDRALRDTSNLASPENMFISQSPSVSGAGVSCTHFDMLLPT